MLVERIMSDDDDLIMPPRDSHLSLSEEEKALLKRWIAEGAVWDGHWAFQTAKRPDLPEVKKSTWPVTEVDRFVLAGLEEEKISPSPAAGPVENATRPASA